MFGGNRLRRHSQQPQQECTSPPPEGSDSCYGVRSLEGSICSDVSAARPSSPVIMTASSHLADTDEPESDVRSDLSTTPTADHTLLPTPASSSTSPPQSYMTLQWPGIIPPSPEDTLHPLGSLETVRATSSTRRIELEHRLSLADLPSVHRTISREGDNLRSDPHTPISMYYDNQSLPSSPASMSYSFSSTSRTSSPVSGIGYRRSHSHSAVGLALGAGADDLVLPTLSLPSSSLHMSLPKLEEKDVQEKEGALKVVLVGPAAETSEVIRALADLPGVDLVDVGSRVGLVRDKRLVLEMAVVRSAEHARRIVHDHYSAFNALLNPSLPSDKIEALAKMAADYARRNEWLHMVVAMDDGVASSLAELTPVIDASSSGSISSQIGITAAGFPPSESRVSTPSPPVTAFNDEATPMPSNTAAGSYFAPHHETIQEEAVPASSPSPADKVVQLLLEAIQQSEAISTASFNQFIRWREVDNAPTPMHSSSMSTTPSSSSYNTPPMPTVAAAHGRGEWNANLSRRLAAAHEAHRQRKGRRSSRGEKENARERAKRLERERGCGPLFPRGSGRAAKARGIGAAGLGGLWDSIFGLGRQDGRDGVKVFGVNWRWGWTVAAAAVLVVGWGCWYRIG